MQRTIDGNFSLDDLANTITTQEQLGFVKLTDLQKAADNPPTNVASLEDDNSPNGPARLVLVRIGANDDIAVITADQLKQGRKLVFNSRIFVSSVESQVAGFR